MTPWGWLTNFHRYGLLRPCVVKGAARLWQNGLEPFGEHLMTELWLLGP